MTESVGAEDPDANLDPVAADDPFDVVAAASPRPEQIRPERPRAVDPAAPREPADEPKQRRRTPRLRVVNWWSGRYAVDEMPSDRLGADAAAASRSPTARPVPSRPARSRPDRPRPTMSAPEQVRAARKRAAERRARARKAAGIRTRSGPGGGTGVAIAAVAVVGMLFLVPGGIAWLSESREMQVQEAELYAHPPVTPPATPSVPLLNAAVADSPDPSDAVATAAAPVLADADAEPLATVLFVNELGPILDDAVRDRIGSLVKGGYERGFRVRGLLDSAFFPERVRDTLSLGSDIDLLSNAYLVRADRPLDLRETRDDLRAWLADTAEIDAVYWVQPAPESRFESGPKGVRVLRLSERLEAETALSSLGDASWSKLAEKLRTPAWPRATETPPPAAASPGGI